MLVDKPATRPTLEIIHGDTCTPPALSDCAAIFSEAPCGTRTSNLGSLRGTGHQTSAKKPAASKSPAASRSLVNLVNCLIASYDTNMNTPTLISLPHLTVLELTGEDAQAFLQAQVPSDVRQLNAEKAQISGWCTAKGRLLTTFVLWPIDHGYRLILASDVAEAIAKRLKMFVLRLKVQITRLDDPVVGLLNPPAALGALTLPAEAWQVRHADGVTAIRLDPTRDLLTGTQAALTAMSSSSADIQTGPLEAWYLADIEQGFPLVTQATSEHYVPQMVNLDKLGGVSFKKGCYPGQEIVARTHYLGKIKRHLYRISATQPLSAGAEVRSAVLNGQSCGSVLSTAPVGSEWLALAVLQQDAAAGEIYLESEHGRIELKLVDEVMPAPEAEQPA